MQKISVTRQWMTGEKVLLVHRNLTIRQVYCWMYNKDNIEYPKRRISW